MQYRIWAFLLDIGFIFSIQTSHAGCVDELLQAGLYGQGHLDNQKFVQALTENISEAEWRYIFNSPKFWEMVQAHSLGVNFSVAKGFSNPVRIAYLDKFVEEFGTKALLLLIEPGIAAHSEELMQFLRQYPGVIEKNLFEIRSQFDLFLGQDEIYRALAITDEQADLIRRKGLFPNGYPSPMHIIRSQFVRLQHQKGENLKEDGIRQELEMRVRWNMGMLAQSLTHMEILAQAVVATLFRNELASGRSLYTFKIKMPRIKTIPYIKRSPLFAGISANENAVFRIGDEKFPNSDMIETLTIQDIEPEEIIDAKKWNEKSPPPSYDRE